MKKENAHPNKKSMAGAAGQGRVIFGSINSGDNLHEPAVMDASYNSIDTAAMTETPKVLAALQARAALAGWVLTEASAGLDTRFFVTRWGRSRELRDVAAVHEFLQCVEGRRRG